MIRRILYGSIIIFFIFSILLSAQPGLAASSKFRYYSGKVVSLYKGTLSVKGEKGEIMYFAVEKETVYTPKRQPRVGERVEVKYVFRKGYNVAQEVKMVPAKKQK